MIEDVLQKPATEWTPDDYAQIQAFTAPFKGFSVKHMTDDERQTLQALFIRYFDVSDARTRAIAFTVIVAGIPTNEVGALRLEAKTAESPLCKYIIDTSTSVYCAMVRMNACDKQGVNYLERELGLRITLHDKTIYTFGALCNMAIRDYIFERGIKPGPLFCNQRRPKGFGDKPLPAISTQCVQRIFSEATRAFGIGGQGQKIQFHTLAAPCDLYYEF